MEDFHPISDEQDSSAAMGLGGLPVENFQCIMDFLPLDSAACLILSRKKVASAIGERTWRALQANRRERLNFLLTMQRDWKEYFICFLCEKLHPLKKCPSLETSCLCLHEPPCTTADGVVEVTLNRVLRWHHAHMIMRLNTQKPMNHSWIQALSCDSFDNKGVPWMHCRGRIAGEHLLMKKEYRHLLCEDDDKFYVRRDFSKICPHWNASDRDSNLNNTIKKILRCNMNHDATKPCPLCNSVIECSSCRTEFVISMLKCNWSHYNRAIYITAWKDLGSCQTPLDHSWRSQCRRTFDRNFEAVKSPPLGQPVYFEPGTIRKTYEELGYPNLKHDGIANMWPLHSDAEYCSRLEQCSDRNSAFSKIVRGEVLDT